MYNACFPLQKTRAYRKAIKIVSFFKMCVVFRLHLRLRRRLPLSFIVLCGTVHINSAIHKAAGLPAAVQGGLWRAFCMAAPVQWNSTSQTQGMAGNCEAGSFVNRAVKAILTTPSAATSLLFAAYGHFSIPPE